MVKKTTTIKTNSKDSEVSSNAASESSSSSVKQRIIHTSQEQSEKNKNEEMRKAVKEGIAEGLQSRAGIESTEDKPVQINSQQPSQAQETVKANEKPNEVQQAYAKMINGLKSLENGLGNREFRGGVSSSLVLGADAISPAFGKAVQVAISTGLGKTLFSGFNSVFNKVLGLKKDKTPEEKTSEALDKQNELAEQQIESTEDTNQKLESINDTLIAQAKGAKSSESATVAKEKQAEAREREKAEGLQRLFKGTQKAAKKTSAAMGTLKKWFTGFSLAVLADYLFNEQFRETVNVYIKDIFTKGSIAAKVALTGAIGAILSPLWTPFSMLAKVALTATTLFTKLTIGFGQFLFNLKPVNSSLKWIASKFKSVGSNLWNLMKNPIKSLSKSFSGIKSKIGEAGKLFKSKVSGLVTKAKSTVINSLKSVGSNVGTWVKNIFSRAGNAFMNLIKGLKSKILGILSKIPGLGKLADIGKKATDVAKKIATKAKGTAGKLLKVGSKKLLGAAGMIWDAGVTAKDLYKHGWTGTGDMYTKEAENDSLFGNALSMLNPMKMGFAVEAMTNKALKKFFPKNKQANQTAAKNVEQKQKEEAVPSTTQIVIKPKATNVKGNESQTKQTLKTDTNNGRRADMEKPIKVIVVRDESKQEQPEGPSLVNTLPSNPAMRPAISF